MNKIRISAIAAMSQNRVIGVGNKLPWHIPAEFAHFRDTTRGKPVIMGRKSYESLGKPLPGRANIVISKSRRPETENMASESAEGDGPFFVQSLDEALSLAQKIARQKNIDEVFIAGGAKIYEAALPLTQRLYLTTIHRDYRGDTFFPPLDMNEWKEISAAPHKGDPDFTISVLERI